MEEQLQKIREDETVGRFRVILAERNDFLTRRAFGKILQDCGHWNIDFVPLLRKAINMPIIGRDENLPTVEVPMRQERHPDGRKQCMRCHKSFDKGEKGWTGWKRFCKEDCQITDLV